MVPKAVSMKSDLVSLNTAKQVNTAHIKTIVNGASLMSNLSKTTHLTVKRPINKNKTFKNRNFNQKVNTVKDKNVNFIRPKAVVNAARPKAVVNVVKGNNVNAVKSLACWVWKPKTKIQVSNGLGPQKRLIFLPYVKGNLQQDLQEKGINEDFVAFGGNPKGGKITGRGTIKSGNLDIKNVYFVKELNITVMKDKFYLTVNVPRKNNMYSVDLKNIVPKGGLTCLFAKATCDESKLWHRRLGHINFKTINKLVKGNLVRGLPSKLFENNQTCVACQKGKQHRASCKSKTVSLINQPLHMLHMDLFGPTLVKSLMKKMYCLVVTDDYSRFSWVFFLATKDETSGILKSFITGVENLIDQRVKAKAVNNACYVQNMVLVTKPHNKTPYERFLGKKPAFGFIRPFWCLVTILNNIDHLGKFDGKADEGFFVGYSINSKAFKVFSNRTRIVEENLHVQFSEDTPNIAGSGPNWLFNIDALTKSKNYKPVVAGNQSNGNAGTKACDDADKARMETVPGKDYILLPLWTVDPSFSQKKDDNVNSTNNVNAASTNKVNVVSGKTSIELLNDPNMPALEDIVYSDDDEDVGAKADMNNLDASMSVSPILTTRVHKDDPVVQIIGDLNSAPQTRRMTKNLEEYMFVGTSLKQRTNHKDLQNCLFACFLSQEEPKKVIHAFKDPSWIEALQEELLQFKLQEVWTLADLPNRKRAIGTKWYIQEEGIDYDEFFSPVARIEAIRLFLAYASFKYFVVYQIDVKSTFLYGNMKEEVYVCQPPGFEIPDFLDRVYKVGRSARMISSDESSLGDQKDASKQERKIDDIDKDAEITLVDETQGRYGDDLMFDTVTTAGEVVTTASVEISNASPTETINTDDLTLAQTLIEIRNVKPKVKGVVIEDQSEYTTRTRP
ncbi:putative ribonuclease H-like domain-containing protein [Tanacetum coccineum]|uniref:Ribonuclease H-like domain-containing protein n=1 Tax=Tanacetum coccineum TaxID=301880 RepID=A0ABQ5BGX0_9ASTR